MGTGLSGSRRAAINRQEDKAMRSPGHFLFLSFLLFLTACGDSQTGSESKTSDVLSENVSPEYGSVEGTRDEQRKGEQRVVEARLETFGDRLDALKLEAEQLGDQGKAEIGELIQALEKKMAVAEKRLEELKSASADTWQEAKARTASAVKDLEESYDQVIARLKQLT
jgi:hypothetical protein